MRDIVVAMQSSRIREVANAALKRPDVLAFWFGESDEVTPEAVSRAAVASLARGETFYGHNLGLPELREALVNYTAPAARVDRVRTVCGHVIGRQRPDAGHAVACWRG